MNGLPAEDAEDAVFFTCPICGACVVERLNDSMHRFLHEEWHEDQAGLLADHIERTEDRFGKLIEMVTKLTDSVVILKDRKP